MPPPPSCDVSAPWELGEVGRPCGSLGRAIALCHSSRWSAVRCAGGLLFSRRNRCGRGPTQRTRAGGVLEEPSARRTGDGGILRAGSVLVEDARGAGGVLVNDTSAMRRRVGGGQRMRLPQLYRSVISMNEKRKRY